MINLPPKERGPSSPSLSLVDISRILLFQCLQPGRHKAQAFLQLCFVKRLRLYRSSITFVQFYLLLHKIQRFAMKTDNNGRKELPTFKADTPPVEYTGRSRITACRARSFRLHIPNSEVIEVIGKLVVITSLTRLHESTRTIINQRSTRLRGMRLKAGIQSPMYPPNDSTHTRF